MNLFEKYVPNPFTLLHTSDANKYLPKLITSMPTTSNDIKNLQDENQSNLEWKRWRRFEGSIEGGKTL